MSKTDGGPAFPTLGYESTDNGMRPYLTGGMTLRDYFAAAVLSGNGLASAGMGVEMIAELAYQVADAMLAERDK